MHFTITRTTSAPIERVFDLITDHARYKDMTPLRTSELLQEGTPAPNGVGARRKLGLVGPAQVEEVTEYVRPTRMVYRLTAGLPVKDHVGTIVLTDTGGGTRVDYTVQSTPIVPLTGLVLGPVLKIGIGGLIDGVIKAAERG